MPEIDESYLDENGDYIDDEIVDEYADIEFDDDDDESEEQKPKSKYEDLIVSICVIIAVLVIFAGIVIYSFRNIIFD